MTDMPMSDEDREELAALQHRVNDATAERTAAVEARDAFMNRIFNAWRADIHEIVKVTGMHRSRVHTAVKGPRTGTRKPLVSRRWRRNSEEES